VREQFTCSVTGKELHLRTAPREGSYVPWWKQVAVVVYGWDAPVATAKLGQKSVATHVDTAAHAVHVTIPEEARGSELVIAAQ